MRKNVSFISLLNPLDKEMNNIENALSATQIAQAPKKLVAKCVILLNNSCTNFKMKRNSIVRGVINCQMKRFPLSIRIKGDATMVDFVLSFNKKVDFDGTEMVFSGKNNILIPE